MLKVSWRFAVIVITNKRTKLQTNKQTNKHNATNTYKNVKKNCGLGTSYRRMTHLKLQKLQKGDYPPEHRLNVNVLLSNITFL